MAKKCIITWIDGSIWKCELEPVHIKNLLEITSVQSIKEIKKSKKVKK